MRVTCHTPDLDVKDLKVHFGKKSATVHAVDGVSFTVWKGTTFGIVGESCSGTTTTALAVMRLTHITEGTIRLQDWDMGVLDGDELRQARRAFQIIACGARRPVQASVSRGRSAEPH